VLSLPLRLRCALAFDHERTLALTRIAQEEIGRRYGRLARGASLTEPRGGAFVAIQRRGADLRPNVHLHAQFLDGAYGTNAQGREVFFQAPAPAPAEVEAVFTPWPARGRSSQSASRTPKRSRTPRAPSRRRWRRARAAPTAPTPRRASSQSRSTPPPDLLASEHELLMRSKIVFAGRRGGAPREVASVGVTLRHTRDVTEVSWFAISSE